MGKSDERFAMSGVSIEDRELFVERAPNALDELAIAFSRILAEQSIEHVYVAGYLAILTGRARGTEDIAVLIEPLSPEETNERVAALQRAEYWGPAMPLESLHANLSEGLNIWVASDGQMTPHLEVKFPTDEYDRASLENALDAHIAGETIPVGPLELQIASKLDLGTRTDFEDAAHLYQVFRENLRGARLETWVERLGVTTEYERLQSL